VKFAARTLVHLVVLGLLLAGCGSSENPALEGTPSPSPSIKIVSPESGSQVKGNVVALQLDVAGIQIRKADGDTSGRTGHFHVFVDKPAAAIGEVIPMERGVIHSADNPILIPGLTVGHHKLTVALGDGNHQRITNALAVVEFDVTGPALQASAPAEAAQATGFNIDTQVQGVQIVAAAQDKGAPGTTGHLHLIIDPASPPSANGQPLPQDPSVIHTAETSYHVTGLAAGPHTIWVVLGDKTHVPFSPLVADKVVVNVK
jgi:hypothetical protein